jgi:Tetratricopeptide repeat/Domain of unknown function (DUF4062)
MTNKPVIFISAVSKELRSARDLVAKTLLALGYEPKWQDIAATDAGDLRGVLRKWVDDSDAVLQLVGHCYGFGPKTPDPDFGACSYTQYEALYARQQGKPVYYIFTDDAHPTDGCGCEPKTLHDLQAQYRQQVKGYGDLYHSTSSLTQTELLVRRLQDDLAKLRAEGQKQHRSLSQRLALVLGILFVLVLGIVWVKRDQGNANQTLTELKLSRQEEGQALADLRQMLETSIKGGSEAKLTADYDAALRFIAQKRGIPLPAFRAYLEQNATQALGDRRVSWKDKVRALQEAGQFVQSRDYAIEQAHRLEVERQKSSQEEVELWTEAAKTEITLGHYDKALAYATKAVTQTDRQADFATWSAARHQQGRALSWLRKDKEAQSMYEELIPLQQAALGPDHLTVLQSRRTFVSTIYDQGNYAFAEQQDRALVADCQRVLGAEHPDTLASRNNLANALNSQAKYAEAEQEHRERIKIEERVLGAEHPDTLLSRIGLANVLYFQAKYAEAEQEYRAVLKVQERMLGAEHPATLMSRMGVANVLQAQAKNAEAEQEHRAVLKVSERVLGAEHPDTLASRMGVANTLRALGNYAEAEQEHRAVLKLKERVLGAEHPDTLMSRNNLANALDDQGKHAEAEQEHRAALKLQERVLGAEHPDVALSCYNLALFLEAQKQLPEALGFMQRAEQVWTKALGSDHPYAKRAKAARERLEAALKEK